MTKHRIICIAFASLVLAALLPFAAKKAAALLSIAPPIYTQKKSDVALDEDDAVKKGAEHANVLFMLDVGSPMTFSPNGTMPEWNFNVFDQNTAAQMLQQATYGHGGLPVIGNSSNNLSRTRYGREMDDEAGRANNMTPGHTSLEEHANNYYSPFDYTDNPAAYAFGKGSASTPYALVFRNPAYWTTPPSNFTVNDLVPNDSRMYKMKLVMWRILSETVLLENLRIGMATTFQEHNGPGTSYGADFYKSGPLDNPAVAPWIPNYPPVGGAFFAAPGYGAHTSGIFKWGSGPSWSTYLPDTPFDIPGMGYYQSASASWGIDREYYNHNHYSDTWKVLNRAYLRVPIKEYSEAHINKFRLWIDGFEDITLTDTTTVAQNPYVFKNPELYGDGKTFLSTAIFPGHDDLDRNELIAARDFLNRPGIVFSSRTGATKSSINPDYYNQASNSFVGNYFKAGSGEALGTVLDFFSPPVSGKDDVTGDAYNVTTAPEENFPLRDPCEKNWLIVFTAGDDSAGYLSNKAVKDLFDHTNGRPLTKLKEFSGGTNKFDEITLQDGVRTLVIGFVDPDSQEENVKELRKKLNEMAEAGDPGNPNAQAFFANDVEGLINALRSALARVNSEIQPAKGSMLEADSLGDEETYDGDLNADTLNLYAGSYRVNIYDQWQGRLARYEAVKDKNTGEIKSTRKWELNHNLITARDTNAAARNLYFWAGGSGGNFQKLDYTPPNKGSSPDSELIYFSPSNTTPHPIISTYGVNLTPPVASMDSTMLTSGNRYWANRTHPSRALINWYYGWELAYAAEDTQYPRKYKQDVNSVGGMLSDTGMSGITKVGPPEELDSLPGFLSFAQSAEAKARPSKLYFQSNDGLLHVVDAKDGGEDMAILPPPSLLPYRLFGLKTRKSPQNGLYQWINVDGYLVKTDNDTPITSIPSFILDGPAQVRYFDIGTSSAHDWRPYLIATLGRGGGGIYAMDVSDPPNPKFMWYHENYEDGEGKVQLFSQHSTSGVDPDKTVEQTDSAFWTGVYGEPDEHPYEQLGFNSPRPHFGVARHETDDHLIDPKGFYNIIALPGGVQNYLDLGKNGAMGSALYLIDPDIKYHNGSGAAGGIRVFNSGSLSGVDAKWRARDSAGGTGIPNPYMGMMVSEPIFLAAQSIQNNWVADGLFASDNRGNIFMVSFIDPATDNPLPRSAWQIRTIASLRKSGDADTDSYSIPGGVVAGTRVDRSGEIWIAGGTSNVGTRGHTEQNSAMIKNKEQMIFCFRLPELKEPTKGMTYRDGGNGRPGRWTSLDADDGLSEMNAPDDDGWYIPLRPKTAQYGEEYVTTRPVMFGGNLYIATFRERLVDANNATLCESGNVAGESRLYAVEMDSGRAGIWRDANDERQKYLTFDGLKMTGFTISKTGNVETLLITYAILDTGKANMSLKNATDGQDGLSRSEGDLDFLSLTLSSKTGAHSPVTSNDGVINYWRYY